MHPSVWAFLGSFVLSGFLVARMPIRLSLHWKDRGLFTAALGLQTTRVAIPEGWLPPAKPPAEGKGKGRSSRGPGVVREIRELGDFSAAMSSLRTRTKPMEAQISLEGGLGDPAASAFFYGLVLSFIGVVFVPKGVRAKTRLKPTLTSDHMAFEADVKAAFPLYAVVPAVRAALRHQKELDKEKPRA